MLNDDCPCNGCIPPKRTSDCHGKCPDYEEWTAEQERKKQARYQDLLVDNYLASKAKYVRKWKS